MKIERIKAVRELAETEFKLTQLKTERNKAEDKCVNLGFSDMFVVYDFMREYTNELGTVGLRETKEFVERQFPEVIVEDVHGNNYGKYDSLKDALTYTVARGDKQAFYFYQNGFKVAMLDLS